jgi:hypothetical protein
MAAITKVQQTADLRMVEFYDAGMGAEPEFAVGIRHRDSE